MKKKAKLILAGGSAYGLAHIGVLAAVEQEYEISGIIGTSMGAIVGAMYALGKSPAEILNYALDFSSIDVFHPLDLDFTLSGIYDGKASLKQFGKWTDKQDISSGRIPFIAVAYDLLSRSTILIDKGQYAKAMRASSSLPYIYAPFSYGSYLFVDGGIEHPLPIAFEDRIPGDLIIAVNVLPPLSVKVETINLKGSKTKLKMRSHQVFLQSILQNQGFVAVQSMIHNPPDIVIDAHDANSSVIDISKAQDFYDHGYARASSALEDYQQSDFTTKLIQGYQNLLSKMKFRGDS